MKARRDTGRAEKARAVIQDTARRTQEKLRFHIADLGSLALYSVWEDDPYQLDVSFGVKANRTEAVLGFRRGTEVVDPMTAAGGGAVDVAAFALRVALWHLSRPRTRPVLILDEPFRNLSVGLLSRASEMVKTVSHDLNLQIIMVSHAPDLVEAADRVFRARWVGGVTTITQEDPT
jgi:ABC-type uncharacterized transport system YnjBCD ATPase subunit